ncbi:MAG: hypothetical protein RR234_10485 [Christensenella sp.]
MIDFNTMKEEGRSLYNPHYLPLILSHRYYSTLLPIADGQQLKSALAMPHWNLTTLPTAGAYSGT